MEHNDTVGKRVKLTQPLGNMWGNGMLPGVEGIVERRARDGALVVRLVNGEWALYDSDYFKVVKKAK